jgi:short-subunit dehydrogenase
MASRTDWNIYSYFLFVGATVRSASEAFKVGQRPERRFYPSSSKQAQEKEISPMALYRANPSDGVAWITGASTGIGRAVALDLCRQGYTVAATARDAERLHTLEAETAGMKGRAIAFACDVTDEKAMLATIVDIEAKAGPITLALFNAGNYFPTRGDRLDTLNIINTFEINLFGVVYGLVPTANRMRERGRGQIVLVGSASSYFGWPSASAYGASKAALNNMAEGLKYDFDKMNIRLQVVNPGFVDTPLTEKNQFPMPALMKVEDAAARLVKAIASGGFETSFPHRFTWFLKALRILPQAARYWILNRITGWKSRPLAAPKKLKG